MKNYSHELESREIKDIKSAILAIQGKYSWMSFTKEDFKKGASFTFSTATFSESSYIKFDGYVNGKDFPAFEIRISNHPRGKLASISNLVQYSYSDLTPEIIVSLIEQKMAEIKA